MEPVPGGGFVALSLLLGSTTMRFFNRTDRNADIEHVDIEREELPPSARSRVQLFLLGISLGWARVGEAWCSRLSMLEVSIPEQIQSVRCRATPGSLVEPEGIEVFRNGLDVIALPCFKPGKARDTVSQWSAYKKNPAKFQTRPMEVLVYFFMKAPDGSFVRAKEAGALRPDYRKSIYTVSAHIRLEPADERRWNFTKFTLKTPTPPDRRLCARTRSAYCCTSDDLARATTQA